MALSHPEWERRRRGKETTSVTGEGKREQGLESLLYNLYTVGSPMAYEQRSKTIK